MFSSEMCSFCVITVEVLLFLLLVIKMHDINGVSCEVKKAVERDQKGNLGGGGGGRGG